MECFTKILSIFFKGVFLKKLFLWNEPLRKIGFVKKSVLNSKKYLKSIRADKKKLCIFRKFCQLGLSKSFTQIEKHFFFTKGFHLLFL